MPCFQGIDVFVGTDSELERLPEFPHPDSASVNIVLPDQGASVPGSQSFSHYAMGGSTARGTRINPRVSVYIPLLPGARFWIHYSIIQFPTPPGHIYLKFFANGENITGWGVDPAEAAAGTVAGGLYEPDENWHYRDGGGKMFKQEGIESRSFRFVSHPSDRPLTENDGVMEVQIFRAKSRRRCRPG